MKKLILTLVFVFTMGMFTNVDASSNDILLKSCADGAYDLQGFMEENGESKADANETASIAYDLCISGHLVFK